VVYLKPKQLIIKDCARRFVLKLYRHEASRGLFATAELLVYFLVNEFVMIRHETTPPYAPGSSIFGSEPPSVEDDVDVWCYACQKRRRRRHDGGLMLQLSIKCSNISYSPWDRRTILPDVRLMTSRELTSDFDFWLVDHLRISWCGAYIFIQSADIDNCRNSI